MTRSSESYYRATAHPATPHPALRGEVEAEVCVVGAGFAGLNTALGLVERGLRDVVVLESEQVAHGASGRNGGFVFAGFSRGEGSLLQDLGPDRAKSLFLGTRAAVSLIRDRSRRYAIECDRVDGGVLWANWFRDEDVLRTRQERLATYFDTQWEWVPRERLRQQLRTERYTDALFEADAFHFHPLNYALGLSAMLRQQGVGVHEHSPAVGLQAQGSGWRVTTPEGSVRARHVVLACGGYLARLRREVDAGVLPIATYVMVTEPLGHRLSEAIVGDAAVYDTRFAFDYYRPLRDTRLLWGGRISVRDRAPGQVERLLRRDLLRVFPQLDGLRVDYAWSGLMSYARHEMPQLGRIGEGLWLAQAFGGHGVAPTTLAGEVIAAAIAENDPRWQDFSDYGLVSALKPAGFVGAQLTYWWLQWRDAWKDRRERRAG